MQTTRLLKERLPDLPAGKYDADKMRTLVAILQRAVIPAGAVGPEGPQGPQGDPGEDGEDGADGAPGAAGPANLIFVTTDDDPPTVVTSEPNYLVIATRSNGTFDLYNGSP